MIVLSFIVSLSTLNMSTFIIHSRTVSTTLTVSRADLMLSKIVLLKAPSVSINAPND